MRVQEIAIKHVLGIKEKRVELGRITEISGRNASGKSSLLEALKAGLGGGDLAKLKMVGTVEEPEIVLVLDEGRFRVEREGAETVVKERVGTSAAYEKIRRPQTWLDSLVDPVLTNPLRFLSAHPNDRADLLLEVLPLYLDREAFMARIADAWPKDRSLVEGHPLEVLGCAREVLFDERTGVNRSQKDKAASAYELQKALPAEMPADPAGEQEKAARERDELFRRIADRKAEAEVAEKRAVEAAQAVYDQAEATIAGEFKTAAAKIRGELERKIAKLKEEAEKAIAGERVKGEEALAAAAATLEDAQAAAGEARRKAVAAVEELQPELQKLNERAATLAAQAQDVTRLRKTKEMADQFAAEAASLEAVSERLSRAIAAVDLFKRELVKDLPIEGLEIQGKQILVGGIPFDQLNTARKISIAVKVATLRARTQMLPLIFVDGAEALDAEQYGLLVSELEKAGVQAILARVEDTELSIRAHEGAAGGAPADAPAKEPPRPTKRRSVLAE